MKITHRIHLIVIAVGFLVLSLGAGLPLMLRNERTVVRSPYDRDTFVYVDESEQTTPDKTETVIL